MNVLQATVWLATHADPSELTTQVESYVWQIAFVIVPAAPVLSLQSCGLHGPDVPSVVTVQNGLNAEQAASVLPVKLAHAVVAITQVAPSHTHLPAAATVQVPYVT